MRISCRYRLKKKKTFPLLIKDVIDAKNRLKLTTASLVVTVVGAR